MQEGIEAKSCLAVYHPHLDVWSLVGKGKEDYDNDASSALFVYLTRLCYLVNPTVILASLISSGVVYVLRRAREGEAVLQNCAFQGCLTGNSLVKYDPASLNSELVCRSRHFHK